MSRFVLGIDGGGTKTEAVVMDIHGEELGRGIGGPGNIATLTAREWQRSIDDSVHEALAKAGIFQDAPVDAVCCAVAGYSAAHPRSELETWLNQRYRTRRVSVIPDFEGAWWAAFEGRAGVILVAGTGAVAYGRDTVGREIRSDGRGFLLGDKGSGFDIGRQALKRLISTLEVDAEPDTASLQLLKFMGCSKIDEVVEWSYRPFQPARIASLAEVIGAMADDNGGWPQDIIMEAGRNLRRTAEVVLQRLSLPRSVPISLVGGLWQCSVQLERAFLTCTNDPPFTDVSFALLDPAWGAAYKALRSALR